MNKISLGWIVQVDICITVHNCFSSLLFDHSLTSPSPIHSAKSESIITQSEEKADFVIVPSEGIENRTGTTARLPGLLQGEAFSVKTSELLTMYVKVPDCVCLHSLCM